MKDVKYELSEVAKHTQLNDAWIAVDGLVLDVTRFLSTHPGGPEILLEAVGRDASKDFEEVGHSSEAREKLREFQIGRLKGGSGDDDDDEVDDVDRRLGKSDKLWGNWWWEWSAVVAIKRVGLSALVIGVAYLARRYWTSYVRKRG